MTRALSIDRDKDLKLLLDGKMGGRLNLIQKTTARGLCRCGWDEAEGVQRNVGCRAEHQITTSVVWVAFTCASIPVELRE